MQHCKVIFHKTPSDRVYKFTHTYVRLTKSAVTSLQSSISLTREQCRYCSKRMTVETVDQCYQ